MSDKVEELLEHTRLLIYKRLMALLCGDEPDFPEEYKPTSMFCKNLSRQILSHPDLALIDREQASNLPDVDLDNPLCGCLPVIPLSDILKEKE